MAIAVAGAPVASIATIVRPGPFRAAPRRTITRRRRRTRSRSITIDGGEDGFYGDEGPFGSGGGGGGVWGGGGGGGGGGRWWDPYGFGDGNEWEEDGSWSPRWRGTPDPAFDVVIEMLGWAALMDCAVFSCKKIWRIFMDREKAVPGSLLPSIC